MGRVGCRGPGEERGDRAHPPGSRGEGCRRGRYPHLAFSPAGLGLGPASGSHRLSHRPYGVTVAVCFCQTLALPTCPVPPSGLSHDRTSTTPGEEAAAGSLYGLQRRTNHSGRPFHWKVVAPPLPFRPRPLAPARWAPPAPPGMPIPPACKRWGSGTPG